MDCIPDAGHQEQITMILGICNIVSTPVEINEYFVGFMAVDDSSGLGLAEASLRRQKVHKQFDYDYYESIDESLTDSKEK